MIAVLSDVHANLEALNAVYKDITDKGIKRLFFLGDIVGYGPNPAEVLDFIKQFEFCLLGNHDEACLKGPPKSLNPAATSSAWWTRRQICPDEIDQMSLKPGEFKKRSEQWEFLLKLTPSRMSGSVMFVHDTPAEPGSWRYVMDRGEVSLGFKAHPAVRAFFFGHSHIPGVWTETASFSPQPGKKYPFKERMMINVGSVGQPRDKDPRSSYVILEKDGFTFVRVPYDVAATQKKIRAIKELDPKLADRLAKGD